MYHCVLIWKDEAGQIVECRNCGRTRKTSQTDISKVAYTCSSEKPEFLPEPKKLPEDIPPKLVRLKNFSLAALKHVANGSPTCTQEQIDERFSMCESCSWFRPNANGGICGHMGCGCNLSNQIVYLNKLAWADQKCPIDKWGVIDKTETET